MGASPALSRGTYSGAKKATTSLTQGTIVGVRSLSSGSGKSPLDGLELVQFRAMEDGTARDYELQCTGYARDREENQVNRVLSMLKEGGGDHIKVMSRCHVDLLEHGLQSATRAERDGAGVDTIVCALLHDMGELICPSNHGDVAAAILRPYISPKDHWILSHHEVFQGYYYFHHVGANRDARDIYKDHEHYEECRHWCHEYDQKSFDPDYDSYDLAHFEPMVREVFDRNPFWWNPEHPKLGCATGVGL